MNSIKYGKKTLYTIVFSIIVTTMLSFGADAEAYSGVCGAEGDNLLWSFDSENGTLTISGDGDMEVWQTSSSAPWSEYCELIKRINFEGNVTSIDEYAFEGCSNLTNIVIPDSVTQIGKGAFRHCTSLEKMTLPFIGAFRGGTNTDSDVFGYIFGYAPSESANVIEQQYKQPSSGEVYYYSSYFYIPNSLKIVVITDETIIPYGAFYGCYFLTEILINDGVETIGGNAFYDCNKIKHLTIPKSVKSISQDAFEYCNNLEEIILPFAGTTPSGGNRLYYPKLLKKVILTNGQVLPRYAFSGCYHLSEIVLNDGVKTINSSVFNDCSRLIKITIPDSVTIIMSSLSDSPNVTIYGYEGSYANIFAIDNSINFVSLGLAEFDIVYNAKWGENAPEPQKKTAYTAIRIPMQEPTRYGYTFKHWEDSDSSNIYAPGDQYNANADLNLSAVWEANTFIVDFEAYGAPLENNSLEVVFNSKYEKLPTPTKPGYSFEGWYLENEYINLIDKDSILNKAENHTLYAKWDVIYVSDISLNYSSISAKIGETTSFLTATVSPSTALDKSVKWSSSDESIATVDQSGNITGISSGSAVITVTANDGNYTDTCTVNVTMVVDPVFSDHASGFVEKGTIIKLFTPTEGTTIYYTKDGSIPDKSDYLYNGAITINSDSTIKAIAIAPDGGKSTSSTYEYETVSTSAYSIEVDTIGACAGNTVKLDVLFNNNPGVHGLVATITFDESVLTLEKIKNGVLFADDEMYDSERTSSSCVLYYEKSNGDTTKDGVLTTLVFKVSDNAVFGNYPVTISYLSGDIVDSDEDMVITETIQGAVNIYPLVFGDVNYDGVVNMQDIVRFKSHLAEIDVVINEEGSDVNHDGDINLLDLYAIRRFLAGLGEIEAPASVMSENDSSIVLPTVLAKKGQTIRFDIQLKDSAGLWGLNPLVSYDKDYLKLTGIENGVVFADGDLTEGDISSDEYALLFTNESSLTENNTSSGTLITLIFNVIKESPDGFTPISFSFDNEHIAMNVSGEKIDISTSMGFVTFDDDFVLPDINSDGVLNSDDISYFVSYMSGSGNQITNKSSADFDGNGKINLYDLNRFINFLKKCDLKNK